MIKTIIILYFVTSCCYGYKNYFRANWECADNDGCEMISCEDGFADCNDHPIDGCEVNTNVEIKNCGHCDVECPAIANGVPTCISGKCGIGWCNVGFADCNYNSLDGCEINLNTDIGNCGHCGIVCSSCVSGKCIESCPTGECNGACVNLQTDPNNCGVCGNACSSCQSGVCVSEYTEYGCVSTDNTMGGPDQPLFSTHIELYASTFTAVNCYNFCNPVITHVTFFTLTVDTTTNTNIICQCHKGTLGTPPMVSGCSNGYGLTNNGNGVIEVYSVI
jgi:hypothetical protein